MTEAWAARLLLSMDSRIWLDDLPQGIREDIAERVSKGATDRSALHLAQTSLTQRKAVTTVMRYRMSHQIFNYIQGFDSWARIFGDDLQHVRVPRLTREYVESYSFRRVLSEPELRSVEVYDYQHHLDAVTTFSLHKVVIIAIGMVNPAALFDAIRKVKAEHLSLRLNVATNRHLWRSIVESNALSNSNITSLEIDGDDRLLRQDLAGPSFWNTICKITSLRELTLREDFDIYQGLSNEVSDEVIPFLSRLESLSLKDSQGHKLTLLPIESSLVDLYCDYAHCHPDSSSQNLSDLTMYKNLKRVHIRISADVQNQLAGTLKALNNLEDLGLAQLIGPVTAGHIQPEYNGGMLNVIRSAPKLTKLSLFHACIPKSELISILEFTGARLESFDTTLFSDEDDLPLERLAALCQAAAQFNPRLQKFLDLTQELAHYAEVDHLCHERAGGSTVTMEKRVIQAKYMVRRLASRAPFLSFWTTAMIHNMDVWMGNGIQYRDV